MAICKAYPASSREKHSKKSRQPSKASNAGTILPAPISSLTPSSHIKTVNRKNQNFDFFNFDSSCRKPLFCGVFCYAVFSETNSCAHRHEPCLFRPPQKTPRPKYRSPFYRLYRRKQEFPARLSLPLVFSLSRYNLRSSHSLKRGIYQEKTSKKSARRKFCAPILAFLSVLSFLATFTAEYW